MENIIDHYETYDEDERLIKDNAHRLEFITTTHFLEKYINKNSSILEVGAGTGRYSLHYAEKGLRVTALDITPKHIEIMSQKCKDKGLGAEIRLGNALDLKGLNDNCYDVVLCLGPLYHLFSEEDKKQCIKESLRVLKPGGILAAAYISRYATFINMVNRQAENINDTGLQNIVDTGVEFGDSRDCFYHSTYDEIERLLSEFEVEKLNHISTDGIGGTLRDIVNRLSEDEFLKWIEYHFKTCSDKSLIGYGQHGLYICQKE